MRFGNIITFHLSKIIKAKFFILSDVILLSLIIGHALSCTQQVFRYATETQLGLKWKKKRQRKKAGNLQSVALDLKLRGAGPELESPALWPLDHAASLMRCLFDATSCLLFLKQSVLADRKNETCILRLVAFQSQVTSGNLGRNQQRKGTWDRLGGQDKQQFRAKIPHHTNCGCLCSQVQSNCTAAAFLLDCCFFFYWILSLKTIPSPTLQ